MALLEAKRHTLDLTRELKILSQNIHSFIQRLFLEACTAQHVACREHRSLQKTRFLRTTIGSRPSTTYTSGEMRILASQRHPSARILRSTRPLISMASGLLSMPIPARAAVIRDLRILRTSLRPCR